MVDCRVAALLAMTFVFIFPYAKVRFYTNQRHPERSVSGVKDLLRTAVVYYLHP